MAKTIVLAGLFLSLIQVGCAGSSDVVMEQPPPQGAWAEVALELTGPQADRDKRRTCLQEATRAGIHVRPGAATRAVLQLGPDGNLVTIGEREQRPLGSWTTAALCRVALAAAVDLDRRVKVSKGEPPTSCQPKGSVEGQDRGFAFFVVNLGSYEGAVADAQFSALRRGANYVALDLARQVGVSFSITGRAFGCTSAGAAGAEVPATLAL